MLLKKKIPVSKPNLPDSKNIAPYLDDIISNDYMSGKRPLLSHLKSRFEKLFNTQSGTIALMSNGTIALANTLRATGAQEGSYCIMPSWAPPSLPYAAIYAGLKPFFVDVDEESWQLSPQNAKESLLFVNGKVGAVIVSTSFGRTVNTSKWDKFTTDTNVPVVIDASTSLDGVLSKSKSSPEQTPIVIGLHANNSLAVEEGAIVISKNKELIERINQICRFGMENDNKLFAGTNGLMTEYNAAVCHAALDSWETDRSKWNSITNQYLEAFIDTTLQHRLSFEYTTPTCNVYLLSGNAKSAIKLLNSKGIQGYRWLGDGCHKMDDFNHFPKTDMTVTENLAESVVGLPFYIGLTKKEIELVVKTLSTNIYKTSTKISDEV